MTVLYLAVSNVRGVILSELSIRAGDTFKNIVHSLLASGSLPAEDALVSYNAGECVSCFASCWCVFECMAPLFNTCRYRFHLLVDTGIRYSCLAEQSDGQRCVRVLALFSARLLTLL